LTALARASTPALRFSRASEPNLICFFIRNSFLLFYFNLL
jgi:hypothetical protein